jgi:hypothetical protein
MPHLRAGKTARELHSVGDVSSRTRRPGHDPFCCCTRQLLSDRSGREQSMIEKEKLSKSTKTDAACSKHTCRDA